jgi:hypothetical protein
MIYKKPTEYDNLTILSTNNNIIGDIDTNNKILDYNIINDNNINLLKNNFKSNLLKENYLEQMDNILINTDINDALIIGIILIVFIVILVIIYKKI